ncbi:MAG: hypothetical protein FPO08_16700 [Geobacter sp.]|nr:MAG: hypothetical protein FPO08_16700 [Geobacter sp.]
MELATLQGSVKQINWAKGIRKNRLQVWQREDAKRFQAVGTMLGQQELASWWIANKENTLEEVCKVLDGGAKPKAPKAPDASLMEAKGTSSAAVEVKQKSVKQKPISEGVVRTMTATGFIQVGPTRDMVTGGIVVDGSLPF